MILLLLILSQRKLEMTMQMQLIHAKRDSAYIHLKMELLYVLTWLNGDRENATTNAFQCMESVMENVQKIIVKVKVEYVGWLMELKTQPTSCAMGSAKWLMRNATENAHPTNATGAGMD